MNDPDPDGTYRRGQQVDEMGHCSRFYNDIGLPGIARGNIGQGPSRLKFDGIGLSRIRSGNGQERHQLRNYSSLNQSVDGRVPFPRQDFPCGLRGFKSNLVISGKYAGLDFLHGELSGPIGLILKRTDRTVRVIIDADISPFRQEVFFLLLPQVNRDLITSASKVLKKRRMAIGRTSLLHNH